MSAASEMSPGPVPVVLVHGLRVSGASLHRIAAGITDRAVATPDLPGHGSRADETFTMDGAVQAVLDAAHALGGPVIVAGMSLGGYVAMATAGRHPDEVTGLVAMCATAQPSSLLAAPFQAFGAATSFLPAQAAAISKGLTRLAVGTRVASDMEAGGLALHSIRDVVGELSRFDALAELALYPGPVEFLNGGWDQFRIHERRFVAATDRTELRVIPRATHLFPLIQPEPTATLIEDFARRGDTSRVA
ncbi:alpha/beta hydrolase [Gordonia sp. ABSL11-1]|uniref:alpha/beta fold hydrolase n=1 Tax=Gordonia sp. ABSL11-1 TaxID=3053924 RepID=UPI002573C4C5|nr:alpha/beta hydrolase [Gordonia sp. ABSL11-1]MDL9945744.1 alpha/beta hydrolase [Gordonia sp. ABSL11-1]